MGAQRRSDQEALPFLELKAPQHAAAAMMATLKMLLTIDRGTFQSGDLPTFNLMSKVRFFFQISIVRSTFVMMSMVVSTDAPHMPVRTPAEPSHAWSKKEFGKEMEKLGMTRSLWDPSLHLHP